MSLPDGRRVILPHAEFSPNDHRQDTPQFNMTTSTISVITPVDNM